MGPYMTEEDARRFMAYMTGAGHTLATLAEALGMTTDQLTERAAGKTDWSRAEMEAAAKALGEDPGAIFYGDPPLEEMEPEARISDEDRRRIKATIDEWARGEGLL